MDSILREVQSSGRVVVAGGMNGHVGKDRAEYEDYMEVMASERYMRKG